ncbi:MAG: VTT domain-containing protein [Lactobacillaceae bacterium]|jgi:uncharacterized membrane protein YdjX (TVP38/TMEM64 family)|nr:VTT domain-containing protein [Lactobacillaceae bacterium]
MKKFKINHNLLITGATLLFVVLLILFILKFQTQLSEVFKHAFNRQNLMTFLRQHDRVGSIILMAMIAIASAIPGFPAAILSVIAGICFGPLLGFLIIFAGSVAGNLSSVYLLAKVEDQSSRHQGPRYQRIVDWLHGLKHPQVGLILGYMIPAIPTALVNYAMDELKLTNRKKVFSIAIGAVPTSVLYTFGGDALLKGNYRRLIIVGVILAIFIALSVMVYRRKNRQVVD